MIKSGLFEYEICELEATVKFKDYSNALEKVEILIPKAKEYGKIKKTFDLHLIKAEIYIKMCRFQEALILINNLNRNSESFGKSVKGKVLYLMTLAKLGLLQKAKKSENLREKENKKLELETEESKTEKNSIKSILSADSLGMKEELKIAAKLFLQEMQILEANQCIYLLARLEKEKIKREMISKVYVKVKRIELFCNRKIELISNCYNDGKEFFKFVLRVKGILDEVSKEI